MLYLNKQDVDSFSKETEDIKKNQMEILELTNISTIKIIEELRPVWLSG